MNMTKKKRRGKKDYTITRKDRNKFRMLWHSVSPQIRSGYGNVTRQLCTRFKEYGYNVTVSAYYGVEPGGVLLINGVPVLPSKQGRFGELSCLYYYKTLRANIAWLMCYDDKTEILTDQGFKFFRNLDGTEKVVQYNKEKDYLEYVKPLRYFVYPYTGKMYSVEGRDISLMVTPNHKMLVKKRNREKYEFEHPDQIVGKRRKYLKIARWKDSDERRMKARELSKVLNKRMWICSNGVTKCLSTLDREKADYFQELAIKAGFVADQSLKSSSWHDRPWYVISIKGRRSTEVRPKEGVGKDGWVDYS